MFTFFATIIIVYILWLVVKPLLARYAQRKFSQKVNDMFRQAYGQTEPASGGDYGSPYRDRRRQSQRSTGRARRKIFGRDEGEYIDFEEIRVDYCSSDDASYASSHAKRASGYTPREPQISDADWEEL